MASTSKVIDYDALAIRLAGRSPLACALVAVQTSGRRTGLKQTKATTLVHKAKTQLNTIIHKQRADAILHLYSEFGLGSVGKVYNTSVITWNPRLEVFKLGEACKRLWRQCQAARKVDEIGKGKMVVCMLPEGSLEALIKTGLAKCLEVEILQTSPK